ncbi:hypothetical protein S245_049313, partial [Arachis hypogaea]
HGTALVVYLHFFAKIIQVPRQDAQFHTFKEVRFRAGSALAFTSAFIDFR